MKWLFLVYVPRSGSTFLSHNIATRTNEILVLPETKAVEIAVGLGDEKLRRQDKDQTLRALQRDRRWPHLGIDDEAAAACIHDFECIPSLTLQLANRATNTTGNKAQARYCMIKNGSSIWHYKKILQHFDNITFIHVRRDPRGANSSRLKRLSAFGEKADIRAADTWYLAKYWNRYIEEVTNAQASGANFIEVTYEALCQDPDKVIAELFDQLGIEGARPEDMSTEPVGDQAGISNVGLQLSAKELKAKHANAQKPAMASRIHAWQTELSKANGVVIENITAAHIQDRYFLQQCSTWRTCMFMAKAWLRHQSINLVKLGQQLLRMATGSKQR